MRTVRHLVTRRLSPSSDETVLNYQKLATTNKQVLAEHTTPTR